MEDYDVLHVSRTSLLDRVLRDNPLSPRKRVVSRLMYAARNVNKETSKLHLSNYHNDILQKASGKDNKVSGFLLVYPTCCLHVIEAESAIIIAALKSLQSDETLVESVRVLSFIEDVSYRFFPSWMNGFINSPNVGPYEVNFTKGFLTELSTLNINVLKWGKVLSEMDKVTQIQALDSVRSYAEEFLPDDPAVIFSFLLDEGTPKLEEFIDIYDEPPKDIVFENDLVWPMPKEPFSWD